jgi:ATP-dependent Clp protease protease subunit
MVEKSMLFDKDWVDAYFEHGVDIQNRRVWFVGDIEEDSVMAAIKGLYLMDSMGTDPLEIFISSYGGDLTEAHALYDVMGTLKCAVHTFAFGKCMSAAPLILAAGEPGHRWVAPHAEFMAHDWAASFEGKAGDIKADYDWGIKVNEIRLKLLTKHSSKTIAHWRKLCNLKTDYFFTADQAIEWGLADQVWNERQGDD